MENGEKSILAAFLSFLIPGLGEIYVGKLSMGIRLIILAFIFSTATILFSLFAGILYIIIWLYAIYDSYNSAQSLEK
jgi:TM2 domain-containing membrane protein YozV